AWTNLGAAQLRQGKYTETEVSQSKAMELGSLDGSTWANLGAAQLLLGKYLAAENALSKAVKLQSQNGETWVHLGLACRGLGKYTEGEEALSKAVELDPKDALAWVNLGLSRLHRHNYPGAVEAAQQTIRSDAKGISLLLAWYVMSQAIYGAKGRPVRVLAAYRRMGKAIERVREEETSWETRLTAFQSSAQLLREAADFALDAGYLKDALDFTLHSKARTLGDLKGYKHQEWLHLLPEEERKQVEGLDRQFAALEAERHGWRLAPEFFYRISGVVPKQFQPFSTPEDRKDWESRHRKLEEEWVTLERHIIATYPDVAPYMGSRARPFRTSLKQLRRRLRPGQGVLEFLRTSEGLLAFLITRDGIVDHHRWATDKSMEGEDGPTLEALEREVAES
ncbi:MAG: tetratricopeptide repeat protein, partial [Chloroflexota bacterium]